ncbi:MAG: metal ABC transporter permease [Alphaproteobacteria bacterium]|nr:metal ABC transporter permease [Alphaproteobacteria bacterium]
MLDDFFIRALAAAIGISIMSGPLGCFVIWQRLSYFGDTMAHSALLGVAFSFLFNINMTVTVFATALLIACSLIVLQANERISSDSILGILAHSTLAFGLLLVGFMPWVQVDLMSYLFGDILAASKKDLLFIWIGCGCICAALLIIRRPLLAMTLNEDIAFAELPKSRYLKFIFMILLALLIAVAMKLVGVLLITSLLIIPAATAQRFASSPEVMAVIAALIGTTASILGLFSSYYYDTRSGASIVAMLFVIFLISRIAYTIKTKLFA